MIGLVHKISRRLAAFWAGLLSFAILLVFVTAPDALASHNGPILVVDAFSDTTEDFDGDHHFKTLQAALNSSHIGEYTVISVAAGRYQGDIELMYEGLELRSSAGPLQTAIEGHVVISARDVVISGFSLESPPSTNIVLSIVEDGVKIDNSRISGAKHGVEILGVHGAELTNNQIYDHSDIAILVTDSWDVQIIDNEIRGNGWSAISVDESHDLVINRNKISLNKFGGIWAGNTQRAEFGENEFHNNGIVGLSLERSSEVVVRGNSFLAHDAGLVLVHASANEIFDNTISDGRAGGLVLKNNSLGNLIQRNTIRGIQGHGAIGIRLAGNVQGNDFIENRVIQNGAGLVLTENETGSPINNLFEENEIVFSDSSGVQVNKYAESNEFVNNDIHHNLQDGVRSSGLFGIYENNNIFDNGLAGLLFEGARNFRVKGNAIHGNGTQGISLSNTSGALVDGNEVLDNHLDGIAVSQSRQVRLIENLVSRNGALGVNLADVERVAFLRNLVENNRELGVFVNGGLDVVLEENEIFANRNGGLRLDEVVDADIEANHFEDNFRYGLYVMNSDEVDALRNFWGDSSGPAGGFAGSGDAALGLDMEQLSPWLPAAPADLMIRSVTGEILQTAAGQRVQFDASDRLGLVLELYNPGRDGHPELEPLGLIVAARHEEKPEIAPDLENGIDYFSLNLDGINSGTAELTAIFDEADLTSGIRPEDLRLFVLRNGNWQVLPGAAYPDLQRVTGELPVEELRGVLLGLGTIGDNVVITEQGNAPTQPEVEEAPQTTSPADEQSRTGDDEQARVVPVSASAGSSGSPPASSNIASYLLIGFVLLLFPLSLGLYLWTYLSRSAKIEDKRASSPKTSPGSELEVSGRVKPAHTFRIWHL